LTSELIPPHYRILNIARDMERRGIRIIHMEIGDPDIETDKRIIDAMYISALKGYTHYGDSRGSREFREATSEYLNKRLGTSFDSNNIIPVPGSKSAIYMILKTLSSNKAKVAVIEPTWGVYYSFIRDLNYNAISIKLSMDNRWQPTDDEIDKIGDADFIAVINPSNPTGTILSKDSIDRIVDKAKDNGSIIIADEIYFDLIYSGKKFYSFHNSEYENVIGLYSFSKTFAMTGFRLGWIASRNEEFIEKIAEGYQLLLTNVPEFIQHAGVEALKHEDIIKKNKKVYNERIKLLSKGLSKLGFEFVEPEAGFYIFSKVPKGYKDSKEFAEKLLYKKHIAVAPGTAFGDYPEYIRFSATLRPRIIKEALERIEKFLNE